MTTPQPPRSIDLLTAEGRAAVLDAIYRDHQLTLDYQRELGLLKERFTADAAAVDWESEIEPVRHAALDHLIAAGTWASQLAERSNRLEAELGDAGGTDDLDTDLAAIRADRRDGAHAATLLHSLVLDLGQAYRDEQDRQFWTTPTTNPDTDTE